MTESGLEIESVLPSHQHAEAMMRAMFADLDERYRDLAEDPPPTIEWFLGAVAARAVPPEGIFLVARVGGEPVASGAVVPLVPDERIGEVKRLYVVPAARRQGVSRRILAEVEVAAAGLGYRRLHLETGQRQPEAIGLYRSAGWEEIPRFGLYADDPLSVCFGKDLALAPF